MNNEEIEEFISDPAKQVDVIELSLKSGKSFNFEINKTMSIDVSWMSNPRVYLVRLHALNYNNEESELIDIGGSVFSENCITKLINKMHEIYLDTKNYSKILDEIVMKHDVGDKSEVLEKRMISSGYLFKNPVQQCIVCYDYNMVLTKCKHNLCRICFDSMYKKVCDMDPLIQCPVCKQVIYEI